jgi:MFS family permease
VIREYLGHVDRFSRPARLFLAAQFLYSAGAATVWMLRNLLLREAGFDEPFIGHTLAATSFGAMMVLLLAAPFMDRLRLKLFLAAGLALLAAGLAGTAWTAGPRSPFPVLAFSFVSGLGMALFEVGVAPFFMRHSGPAERPYLFAVGTALSPAAGLLAAMGMKAGALAWGEGVAAHRDMVLVGAGFAASALLVLALIRESEAARAGDVEERFDYAKAARFCLPELVFGLGAGLTIPFINLYFRSRFGQDVGTIGLYYSGAQALMMVAFLLAPVLARRYGAVRTIVFFQLTSVPFFLVLAFTTTLEVAVGAFLLRHACMNMVHPVSANFMMEAIPPRQRARMNGMKQTSNKAAWVLATVTGGYVIKEVPFVRDGFTTVMLVTIALYILGSLMYWRFFRGERPSSTPAGAPEGKAGAGIAPVEEAGDR